MDFQKSGNLLAIPIRFSGELFEKAIQIAGYQEGIGSEPYRFSLTIPARVLNQLNSRKAKWPINYTVDDLRATWTDPSRLLLFINIADPFRVREDFWIDGDKKIYYSVKEPISPEEVSLVINGEVRQVISANNGVYPYEKRTFLGFYVDVSDLQPDREHWLELALPDDLVTGQFQGIFLGNIENETTSIVQR